MRAIDFFEQGHALEPEEICILDEGTDRQFSYRQMREMTLRIANGLLAEGLGQGRHGAVYSPNNGLGFICMISLFRAGMSWVPLNPRNAIAENIGLLQDLDCEVLFYHSMYEAQIEQVRQQVPGVRTFVCIDKETSAPALEAWLSAYPDDEIPLSVDTDSTAVVAPTSGTTGRSKGVLLTNRSFAAMMNVLGHISPTEQRPVYLAVAPLTHFGGYVAASILARGGSVVIQADVDLYGILTAISRYKISILFLPPTVVYGLLAVPELSQYDLSPLQYLIYGASPMSPEKLSEALEVFGPVMVEIYGQTELCTPVTSLSVSDHYVDGKVAPLERLASCGRMVSCMDVEIAVMDDVCRRLPQGEIGELVVKSEGMMKGYYKNPELTAKTIVDGWLHTGDVGYVDAEGYFYIVDRKKDMIVTGGFNVFSSEVEKVISSHPAVVECAVFGVPDDKWGEAVKAAVKLKDGPCLDEAELVSYCKELIGAVKAPKSIDFVEDLPKTVSGKLQKQVLRSPYWGDRQRSIS